MFQIIAPISPPICLLAHPEAELLVLGNGFCVRLVPVPVLSRKPPPPHFSFILCVFFTLCFLVRPPLALVTGMTVKPWVEPGFLEGSTKSRSSVDALYGLSSDARFPDLKPSTFHGLSFLWILDEEVLVLVAPLHFVLVDFFPLGVRVLMLFESFSLLSSLMVSSLYNFVGSFSCVDKLVNDLDYSKFFSRRSYFIRNCYMKLTKWSPLPDIGMESPVIPI
ncbi:hypothetical protein IEQ34_021044 [Dendrobium chrysotoxum]|uniref:Uncharacterized protein n=1 Tax=Dendrobium chrysotoxum TaxID=161865 RepID=A0AAV7G3R4_DENCH|nr:hypothetical protein IEQ34_021044 [Dendrobium chrysotoxum]